MCRSEIEILKERIKSLEDQVEELHAFAELLRDDVETLQMVMEMTRNARVVVPRE
jgi:predicted  nucleic acid-binding Zn-ribbon protein